MGEVFKIDGMVVDPDIMETTTASEDFKENILSHKRYVDKTQILIPLLKRSHETVFFLRPRRFGKTLALSMIRYYMEDTLNAEENAENRKLFEGMKIVSAGDYYTKQMTSCPVINLTLQSVKDTESFQDACAALVQLIQDEYERHSYVLNSDKLTERNKAYFRRIMEGADPNTGKKASLAEYRLSLKRLSEFLRKWHGRKAVVLIDEYDVPLEKAYQAGYYEKMAGVISPLMQNVLKTNSVNLQFAVVTGCLRVAKESIYTGLNNPDVNTVLSDNLSTAFGFTEEETRQLLSDSGFSDHFEEVREWYDGYHFGTDRVYNPWSVIRHIEALAANPAAKPGRHWAGTSENSIIRELAARGSYEVRDTVEKVMSGEPVTFRVRDNLVYSELDYHDDNVFTVMLHAGYLTAVSYDGDLCTAIIPNKEVHGIFRDQIREWFDDHIKVFRPEELYEAMEGGNAERIREILVEQYLGSMSFYDTQEAYYHGVLMALLSQNHAFRVISNGESGNGRFDLAASERVKRRMAYIIEVKVSRSEKAMEGDAEKGARQVKTMRYASDALRDGYQIVRTYGIAFYRKDCRVCAGEIYRHGG